MRVCIEKLVLDSDDLPPWMCRRLDADYMRLASVPVFICFWSLVLFKSIRSARGKDALTLSQIILNTTDQLQMPPSLGLLGGDCGCMREKWWEWFHTLNITDGCCSMKCQFFDLSEGQMKIEEAIMIIIIIMADLSSLNMALYLQRKNGRKANLNIVLEAPVKKFWKHR